jgi:hypothetical protein
MDRLVRSSDNRENGGQSLAEMAVGTLGLLVVVVILFEGALLFRAYLAVRNASREGASYAAQHPVVDSWEAMTCEDALPEGSDYGEYVWHTCQRAVAAGLSPEYLQVVQPTTPQGTAPHSPVRVTVNYQLVNPTHGILLPFLGRLGWLSSFPISASAEAPSRW